MRQEGRALVHATFFREKIALDAEYIFIQMGSDGKFKWEVSVTTGKKSGAENAKHLYTRSAETLIEGERIFHEICDEYRRQAWKEYRPQG
jgi:hypothetical protein